MEGQVLKKYNSLKKRHEKLVNSIKREYSGRIQEITKEILDILRKLETEEPPKNVDPHLLKIALRERKAYVSSLRRVLTSVGDVTDLETKLEELSKLHVSKGRYLLALFEKEVYRINTLLKELGSTYAEYLAEVKKIEFPNVRIPKLLSEIELLEEELKTTLQRIKELEKTKGVLLEKMEAFRNTSMEKSEFEEEVKGLEIKLKTMIVEVQSKASKLKKPIKKMRLPEAERFLKEPSMIFERPDEFLELVKKVYPSLDKKGKKAADWLLANLKDRLMEIKEIENRLNELRTMVEDSAAEERFIQKQLEDAEKKIGELKEHTAVLEGKIKRLKGKVNKGSKVLEEFEKHLG